MTKARFVFLVMSFNLEFEMSWQRITVSVTIIVFLYIFQALSLIQEMTKMSLN